MDCLSYKDKNELRRRLKSSCGVKSEKPLSTEELKAEIKKEKLKIDTEQMKIL